MIYSYKKYKDVDAFVKNTPKSKIDNNFTILHKCGGLDTSTCPPTFTNRCFGCLFCLLQNDVLKEDFLGFWERDIIKSAADNAFLGNKIEIPVSKKQVKNPIKNLELFTAIDETTNIQPWAAGVLNSICSTDNRISIEVPVFHPDYDRNGRLDICSITTNKLIILESKTTLDDALSDERFVEQHKKYTEVIEKSTENYVYITLIGGNESDLFPINSQYCTGQIGGKTERFYNLLAENGIKFISANALWALTCKFCVSGTDYSWDRFLYPLFEDDSIIGLLSAGKVVTENGEYIIKPM